MLFLNAEINSAKQIRLVFEPPQNKTNKMILAPSKDSDQTGQSLRCPHKETLGPELPIKRPAKT